ncbi:HAMP domain-containing sensor histidine kinase [Paenibacillus sp. OSY-SE]|uniref:HAMP domain-containing sensor histidine kinase n=1 Tax=Paenibacillus sp. OSY-SE TaxID=1196323 RepID=UPI0002F41E35|nr:HAMP domain-containing histidine kinase [Paenibacillus sp. OSY-SE]
MKLKNKITLLTSVLLICILLCVDLVIYFLFIKIATQNEIESLQTKAEQIIEKIGPNAIMQNKQNRQIRYYMLENTTIRIINPHSEMVNFIQKDYEIELPEPQFSPVKEAKLIRDDGQRVLTVRVPVQYGPEIIGTLEMVERMAALESSLDILVSILILSTAAAALLCFIGGLVLSKTILMPISKSIETMKEIESSLTFKKIPINGKKTDELYKMTETFNRMMERLEESFLKQQQFVSDASHELNTTLTIIEGYASMLRRWGTDDKSIQEESIESIYEESKRMRKMTRQLLDLASSQQGIEPIREPFNLVECCKQASKLVRKLHNREIKIHSTSRELIIVADPTKIKQLLIILIDNALKYSTKFIEIYISEAEGDMIIRVKDFGIGIAEDEIDLVFERFYRVDRARQRKTGGAGLGLPIAQSIVREHYGSIDIVSEEGVGTEVIVHLPKDGTS